MERDGSTHSVKLPLPKYSVDESAGVGSGALLTCPATTKELGEEDEEEQEPEERRRESTKKLHGRVEERGKAGASASAQPHKPQDLVSTRSARLASDCRTRGLKLQDWRGVFCCRSSTAAVSVDTSVGVAMYLHTCMMGLARALRCCRCSV